MHSYLKDIVAYGGKYGSDDSKALIEKRLDHGREVGGRKLKAVKQQHDNDEKSRARVRKRRQARAGLEKL